MSLGALNGINVVEFGQLASAPFCTKLMADYGADVIKIEPPQGDIARHTGPFLNDEPDPEKSGLYFFLNTNKKSVTLDHTTEQGRALFLKLIEQADILVENYEPGAMAAWGLDYATLEKINPNLVMVSITPYGQTGPYAHWKAYDLNAFHFTATGYCYIGTPGEEPLEPGTYLADYYGGMTAATYGMAAAYGRKIVGGGQHVDVSSTDALIATLQGPGEYPKAVRTGERCSRTGQGMPITAPATILPCKDGHVWMIAVEPGHWIGLMKSMGNPEWGKKEEYLNPMARGEDADFIYEKVKAWCMTLNKMEIMESCQGNGAPCTAVFSASELAQHPHLNARNFFSQIDHPVMGQVTNIGAPFQMSATPPRNKQAAPLLGQHNDDVYGQLLGLSASERQQLKADKVI